MDDVTSMLEHLSPTEPPVPPVRKEDTTAPAEIQVEALSVSKLKELIMLAGLRVDDCFEKVRSCAKGTLWDHYTSD